MRLWLKEDKLDVAVEWMKSTEKEISRDYRFVDEWKKVLFARIMLYQNKYDEALWFLKEIVENALPNGRRTTVIEVILLKSLINYCKSDTTLAIEELNKALKLTESGGYIQIFVNEGTEIAKLLEKNIEF